MTVMGSKLGTKSWSDSRQNEVAKSSGIQNISAADADKLGGEDVGSVLNKIADPNYVDPSKKIRTTGNDKMDKDAFMKLMLAQMKNQDPTNPLKSHEMAAQLAQFSSVEQMQNMNTTLNDIKNGQKPTENFQALNFIGKSVAGDSAKVSRLKNDKSHELSFSLPDDAKSVVIKVRNSSGDIVRKIDLKDLKKGDNSFSWNGQDDKGTVQPVGDYQFLVEATNAGGGKLAVKTDFDGMITGINYSSEGPVLLVGTQSVKLKDVKKIIDPSLQKKDQKITNPKIQDLNKQIGAEDTNNNAGAPEVDAVPNTQNLMDTVGMSRDMISRLAKETKPDSKPTEAQANGPAPIMRETK